VQERTFPDLKAEDVKLKIKTIGMRCVAELGRVL